MKGERGWHIVKNGEILFLYSPALLMLLCLLYVILVSLCAVC